MSFFFIEFLLCVTFGCAMQDKGQQQVWPKGKVAFSDSFFPPALQVLNYVVFSIERTDWFQVKPVDAEASQIAAVELTQEEKELAMMGDAMEGEDLRPVIAFVLLDTLKENMGREARRRGFNKFQGFSDMVMEELISSSQGTASSQLRTLLERMLLNDDLMSTKVIKQAETVLHHLKQPTSALNVALQMLQIPPMQYS